MNYSVEEMKKWPIIPLPGTEAWRASYEIGEQYDELWPGQGGYDFSYACSENTYGPCEGHAITNLHMLQEGERDEGSWIWLITLDNGKVYRCEGWCDYTGWDCQSGVQWDEEPEDHINRGHN